MEKTVVIKNATGLHARPAGMFVKKGGLIGTVKDFFGNVIGEYRASEDCRIMYNHYGLSINKGDNVAACGIVKHSVLL